MTVVEKRLLLLGIQKIDPTTLPLTEKPASFTVTASEYANIFPDGQNPWRALKRAAKRLRTRYVKFHVKTGIEREINWVDSIDYLSCDSSVTVHFSYSMHTRLAGMLEQFTQFSIHEIKRIRTMYGIRLFELLSQFKATGYLVITVKDYRFALDCVNKYRTIAELKRNTLIPALKDLERNANLQIQVTDLKEKRKITHFQFIFNSNDLALC
jgi:plasmid replication initiation protein